MTFTKDTQAAFAGLSLVLKSTEVGINSTPLTSWLPQTELCLQHGTPTLTWIPLKITNGVTRVMPVLPEPVLYPNLMRSICQHIGEDRVVEWQQKPYELTGVEIDSDALHIIQVSVSPTKPLPPTLGRAIHALCFQWFAIADAALAEYLHQQNSSPMTLAMQYRSPQKMYLRIVKAIVSTKIHNQYTVLYRHNERDNPLKERKSLVKNQKTLDQVRGIEGLAAREYFACWSRMVGTQWTFTGRNRRPPIDPVNSLLSFAYGLLRVQVTAAVHVAGLDPYIGYLHEVHHGQPSMILDLMEEFRSLIADNIVLAVLRNREIQPQDFNESLGAYRLKDGGRKSFLQAFERKMNDEFKHPVFEYRCTYRRAVELQARLIARHLQEGIPYKPLALR